MNVHYNRYQVLAKLMANSNQIVKAIFDSIEACCASFQRCVTGRIDRTILLHHRPKVINQTR